MKILFVCTGNICRSPTAEGVFARYLKEHGLDKHVEVDSAGVHGYHVGQAPDSRSVMHAKKRGFDIGHLRARQVTKEDFIDYDLILAMDQGHLRNLQNQQPAGSTATCALYLSYCDIDHEEQVPDPYYDEAAGFEYVLDLIEEASKNLIRKIKQATL